MKKTITYDDVAQAASLLLAKNDRPTIRAIHKELGRGSFGTIARHLEAWRQKRSDTDPGAPPEDSLSSDIRHALAKEIARNLHTVSEEKNSEIFRLNLDLKDLIAENDRLEGLLEEKEKDLEKLSREDVRKTERTTLFEASLSEEKERCRTLVERLHEAEKTIARLEVRLENATSLREALEKSYNVSVSPEPSPNDDGKPSKRSGRFLRIEDLSPPDRPKPLRSDEKK